MKENKFTPLTIGGIIFNTDDEYYQYFDKNPDKKPFIIVGGIEISMQTEIYLTLK